jgi:predicted YcjX-like family ATPase
MVFHYFQENCTTFVRYVNVFTNRSIQQHIRRSVKNLFPSGFFVICFSLQLSSKNLHIPIYKNSESHETTQALREDQQATVREKFSPSTP